MTTISAKQSVFTVKTCQVGKRNNLLGLNLEHNKFSDRLKQARLDKAAREGREVRQVDAADEMDISRSAYNQWESGATEPKARAVYEKLAKYLGVDPGWLTFGKQSASLPVDGAERPLERPRRQQKPKQA